MLILDVLAIAFFLGILLKSRKIKIKNKSRWVFLTIIFLGVVKMTVYSMDSLVYLPMVKSVKGAGFLTDEQLNSSFEGYLTVEEFKTFNRLFSDATLFIPIWYPYFHYKSRARAERTPDFPKVYKKIIFKKKCDEDITDCGNHLDDLYDERNYKEFARILEIFIDKDKTQNKCLTSLIFIAQLAKTNEKISAKQLYNKMCKDQRCTQECKTLDEMFSN